MRPKKRYVLTTDFPRKLPEGWNFLYQDSGGYVFKVSLDALESLEGEWIVFKSGAIRKIKQFSESKTPKSVIVNKKRGMK